MRQTAERALADAVDTAAVQPYFVGNAPAGHVQLGDGTTFFHRWVGAGKGKSGCKAGRAELQLHACGIARCASCLWAQRVWSSNHPSTPRFPPPCRCQLIQGVPALNGGSGYSEYVWVAKVR